MASNVFTRFVDKDIGHGLVIPDRSFAARHVSDTTEPIDDAMIVSVAALVVSHRLPISLAVWILGAAWAVDLIWAEADINRVIGVVIDDIIVFQIDAWDTVVGGGQEEAIVEAYLKWAWFDFTIPVCG